MLSIDLVERRETSRDLTAVYPLIRRALFLNSVVPFILQSVTAPTILMLSFDNPPDQGKTSPYPLLKQSVEA